MRRHRTGFVALLGALCIFCAVGHAQTITVLEHNGYNDPNDFFIYGDSHIFILSPSEPNTPYWFEAYYTADPNTPAPIESITAVADIGEVEIIVGGWNGRPYGASDVDDLVLNEADGVYATLHYFKITGDLGTDDPVYTGTIAGPMEVAHVGADLYATALPGDFTVTRGCDPAITLEFGSIDGRLTLGETSGDPFGGTVAIDGVLAAGAEVVFPAGLDSTGVIDTSDWWRGTLTCTGDLAGQVSARTFGALSSVVADTLSGTVRTSRDMLGAISADHFTGTVDCGWDFEGLLETPDFADGAELLVGLDFTGTVETDDLAGLIDVSGDYLGTLTLAAKTGSITSTGRLIVEGYWGGLEPTSLVVPGTVAGGVTVAGDVLNGDFELGSTSQWGWLEFSGDFTGGLSIPGELAVNSALLFDGDVYPASEYAGIEIGYSHSEGWWDAVNGYLTVAGVLHMPLEVAGVGILGNISVGSMPDATPSGFYNNLGIYGEMKGSVLVDGEVDGDCQIFKVGLWATFEVTGDMNAFLAIETWNPSVPGDIAPHATVRIGGELAGGCAVDEIEAAGLFEAGSVVSFCAFVDVHGELLIDNDVTDTLELPSLAGTLVVGGDFDIDSTIGFGSAANLSIGELTTGHGLYLGGNYVGGSITVGTLSGALVAQGMLTDAGVISTGDVSGVLTCQGGAQGTVTVGNVTGTVNITGPSILPRSTTAGRLTVDGSIGSTGEIYVGDLADPYDPNDPNGPPPLSGGYIIVNGSLESGGQITAASLASDTSFICINYQGGTDFTWEPNAPVIVINGDPNNPDVYYSDTATPPIRCPTICRGDLNNDATVDLSDINPFILALYYPDDYSVASPGLGGTAEDGYLGGSRVWKGDANCDGTLDGYDINPFVALVYSNCCDPDCPGCQGDGMNGMVYGGDDDGGYPPGLPAPEELAAQLASNVWPELYDDLLAMVLATIDAAPDESTQAYWQAVYAALTQ